MNSKWKWAGWLSVLVLALSAGGCAAEREPINRVQPNALHKSFFVGNLQHVAIYDTCPARSGVSARMTAARQDRTLGEIVNLMQLDSQKIEGFMNMVHNLWDGLYQICGYLAILTALIGPAAFAGPS